MKEYILLCAFCILLWIPEGLSVNCYQCDSNNDPDCTEQFDTENIDSLTVRSSECTVDAASYCIKTTGVYGGVVGTTRFCSSRDLGNQCQYIRYPDHDRVYRGCVYTCTNNNCNAADRSTAISLMTLVSAVAAAAVVTLRL